MRILHNNKPWETWFFQRGRDELLTGRWVSCCWVQRGMTHKVKFVCQGATSWITGIFLRGKIEIFTGGLVSSYVALKRDNAGWGGNCMPRRNALKNGHIPKRKGWALYRRVSELLLSSQERWRRRKWNLYAKVQRPFIKCLIKKKEDRKKEVSYSLIR